MFPYCLSVCLSVYMSIRAITFECLDIETSFLVWWYIWTISRSHLSTKVNGPFQNQIVSVWVSSPKRAVGLRPNAFLFTLILDNQNGGVLHNFDQYNYERCFGSTGIRINSIVSRRHVYFLRKSRRKVQNPLNSNWGQQSLLRSYFLCSDHSSMKKSMINRVTLMCDGSIIFKTNVNHSAAHPNLPLFIFRFGCGIVSCCCDFLDPVPGQVSDHDIQTCTYRCTQKRW